jgi:hypothetical protein
LAWLRALAAMLGAVAIVAPMIRVGEVIYWASGAVVYTWAACALFVAAGLLLSPREGWRDKALAVLLAVLICGLNEIAALALLAFLVCGILAHVFRRAKPPAIWLVTLGVSIGCAATAFFAPGNAVRRAWEREITADRDTAEIAAEVTGMATKELISLVSSPALVTMSLLAAMVALSVPMSPVSSRWTSKWYLTSVPVALLGVWLANLVAGFATGAQPSWRTVDFINTVALPACAICLAVSLLHFRCRSLGGQTRVPRVLILPLLFVGMSATLVLGSAFKEVVDDIRCGRSQHYSREADGRFALIRQRASVRSQVVAVSPFDPRPATLLYMDVDPHPDEIISRNCGIFFGVRSVHLTEGQSRMDGSDHYRYR